ncbi:MAG: glycosyltransferase family 2 protein [Termitinemataceae bacterium]|nr:MAG: glycosyltransferase family 2 protein [Termitinemataceae bacterium]
MQTSIIIVNYNTKEFLFNCITSIYKNTIDIEYEIIVCDNASTDGSIEMIRANFPNVILIENKENIGFGSANNRCLAIAKGKYIFYLNSDTILLNNAVKLFFDYFETHNDTQMLGALGCNLLNENHEIIHSYGDFPDYKKTIMHFEWLVTTVAVKTFFFILHISIKMRKQKSKKTTGEISGYITGADLFVKNNKYAYFDEDFFLYYEEADLQHRMMSDNKKRVIIEGPKIIHLNSGSNKDNKFFYRHFSFSVIQSYISSIIYFKKRGENCRILKLLIIILLSNPLVIKNTYPYIKQIKKL